MKLPEEFAQAIADAYEIATLLFGDPPGMAWTIAIIHDDALAPGALRLSLWGPHRRSPIVYTITGRADLEAMVDRGRMIRVMREIKRHAVDSEAWKEARVG